MRTFAYLLSGGKPRNLDDWIDYLEKKRQSDTQASVFVTLDQTETIEGGYRVHVFRACFNCKTDCGGFATFQKIYGGFLDSDRKKKRIHCVLCAEGRLKRDLNKLEELGVEFQDDSAPSSFQYSSGT